MLVCTSLQTENHTNSPPLSFLQAGCPSCCPTNSVKARKTSTRKVEKIDQMPDIPCILEWAGDVSQNAPSPRGSRPHLTGPPESTSQTASRSVQLFLQRSQLWWTDRQTDRPRYKSRLHLMLCTPMWRNNIKTLTSTTLYPRASSLHAPMPAYQQHWQQLQSSTTCIQASINYR